MRLTEIISRRNFSAGVTYLVNNLTRGKRARELDLAAVRDNIAIISSRSPDKPGDIIRARGRGRNCGFALSRPAKSPPGKIRRDFFKEIDKFGEANPHSGGDAG